MEQIALASGPDFTCFIWIDPMRFLSLFLLLPLPALADPCADRLAELVASPALVDGPHDIVSIGTMGTMQTHTVHHYVDAQHFLVETVAPAGMPDTLHYQGGMYTADGNGGWTLSTQVDAAQMEAEGARMRAEQAAAISSARCGTETREGTTYEVVEGTIAAIPPYNAERMLRYVIDPASGQLVEHGQAYEMHGMKTLVTYTYMPNPELVLPTP